MNSISIWSPSKDRIEASNLTRFARTIGFEPPNYYPLHRWSVRYSPEFWSRVWDFTGVSGEKHPPFLVDGDDFVGSTWFPNSKLNYAENLLQRADDHTAIISIVENGTRSSISFLELRRRTAKFAAELLDRGVRRGDRVVGYLPNVTETVIAMLGTSSVGAVWSSCSPDFGFQGALDRFGQIEPKLLVACDGYYYNGRVFDVSQNVTRLQQEIESIDDVLVLQMLDGGEDDFDRIWKREETEPKFERFPFNHPLFIMYSSGTTGRPKCIVHGAGGTLLQHLKEHQLHVDLYAGSKIFFFTTCGWMMWNWLVTALASGSSIVLYDGSPFHPRPDALFRIAEEEKVTVFGAGAKYYAGIEKARLKPRKTYELDSLVSIQSTGSPLAPESYDYIYDHIKQDVSLASISGGTDLISCFVLGIPWYSVHRGEIQGPGLGMAVDVFNDSGEPIRDAKGELVCTNSFPSKPISFWNDEDNSKFKSAYFQRYSNIWAQGDFAEVVTESGGYIIYGRSDAVLNPGGVRIGTAEIYRQVESMDEIKEALCVGQLWERDVRVVLFVVLAQGVDLDSDLESLIRQRIRTNASPRHVPAVILAVDDIPRTRSGKIAELAVREIIHGRPVHNTSALENPEVLGQFKDFPELQL